MPKRKTFRKRTDCTKCVLNLNCNHKKHNKKGHCQHIIWCRDLEYYIKHLLGTTKGEQVLKEKG